MESNATCWPWWVGPFGEMAKQKQVTITSGCAVNSTGNVACDPEAMRAAAETRLRQAGYLSSLSLGTYTLARYMQSEVGSGPIFERVAVGEAAVNRAKRERIDVNKLLLYRQAVGHPNRGFYGPIHGVGSGTSTAPYGRWASTSQDPTLLTIMLADLIMSGRSENFARGADDQAGPEYWIPQGQAALDGYVRRLAASGKYWVGPIPGVDHWRTFLTYTPGVIASTIMGQALTARGLEALRLPAARPVWSANMPICSPSSDTSALTAIAIVGLLGGAWAFAKGFLRIGQTR